MYKQKSQAGSIHLAIIIALVVIILGWLWYTYQYNLQNVFKSTAISNSVEAVNEATRIIEDKYKLDITDNWPYADLAPPYKQEDGNYYTTKVNSAEVEILVGPFHPSPSSDTISSLSFDVKSLLTDNGYRTTHNPWGIPTYTSGTSICMFSTYSPREVGIKCANIADYLQSIKDIAPIVKNPVDYKTDQIPIYGDYTISEQNELGYQNAIIELNKGPDPDDAKRLYFYKYNDEDWKYFAQEEEPISGNWPTCSLFNTIESKKAFYGTECYDMSAQKPSNIE